MLLDNIWVINLKRSKDRLQHVAQYMKKYNLKFNVFDAIDGKTLSDDYIQNNTTLSCRTILCNKSMIGCALSHKGIWKQLVNDKSTDYYLIFEDDVVFDDLFINFFPQIEEKIKEYDIDFLSFYCSGLLGCGITPKFELNGIKFGKADLPLSLPAYVISKKGATKLLKGLGDNIKYAIDFELANFAASGGINMYLSEKNTVNRNDDLQSTIKTTSNQLKPITFNILKFLNISTIAWELGYPVVYIGMEYEITWMMILIFILFLLNYFYFKSDIFGLFILIEVLLVLS